MSATVEICEQNGAGAGSTTHNITNSNMGDTDAPNLVAATYPVIPGNMTYAKYQRIHVTNMGASSAIQNLKVWRTGALGGAATHVTNAGETVVYSALTYVAPVKIAITSVDNTMPTSVPTTANLGIGSDLAGIISVAGYSDYLVHQIVTNVADTGGSTSTMNYQYDEVV
jgi:hypothetical protein